MTATTTAPLNQPATQTIADEFFREGSAVIPGLLSAADAALLRAKTDDCATNPSIDSRHISHVFDTFVLRLCDQIDPLFADIAQRPAVLAVAEAVLGEDARFNAMNVIRNGPGQAIAKWHLDDVLEFPLPDDIPRFDARIRMPVFWMTIQVALSDIDRLEHGPTQFVPGSHYSGRWPATQENPVFEGRGSEDIYVKAGDAYLTNHQTWHRGAPNLSDRTRYILQLQYAQRWADARFKGQG